MYKKILKDLRISSGFSQQLVAEKINKERSAYAYYELGKSEPNIDTLKKLAKLYNVPVGYLVGAETEEEVKKVSQGKFDYKKYGEETIVLSDLEKDEKELLATYRLLTDGQKEEVINSVNKYLEK